MNKALKYGLFLTILGIIVGALLVAVNSVTAPIIAEQERLKVEKAIQEIAPKAEDISEITSDFNNLSNEIIAIYQSEDEKYVIYKTVTIGYAGGEVTTLVAFDTKTLKIVNAKVTDAKKQTAGVGDQILTHDFQVAGKAAKDYANINVEEIKGGQYNAISGATVSSKAYLKGVKIAAAHFLGEYGE